MPFVVNNLKALRVSRFNDSGCFFRWTSIQLSIQCVLTLVKWFFQVLLVFAQQPLHPQATNHVPLLGSRRCLSVPSFGSFRRCLNQLRAFGSYRDLASKRSIIDGDSLMIDLASKRSIIDGDSLMIAEARTSIAFHHLQLGDPDWRIAFGEIVDLLF